MTMYGAIIQPSSGTSTSTPKPTLAKIASLKQIGDPANPENQKIFRMWFIDNIVPIVGGEAATLLRELLDLRSPEVKQFLRSALTFQINLELGILNEADVKAALKSRQENAEVVFPGLRAEAQDNPKVDRRKASEIRAATSGI